MWCWSIIQKIKWSETLVRCYVWTIALYGPETWAQRKLKWTYLESFEMWGWRGMKKIKWPEKVTNEQVLQRIWEKMKLLNDILRRKPNWIGHILKRNCLLHDVIEGKMTAVKGEGRRRTKLAILLFYIQITLQKLHLKLYYCLIFSEQRKIASIS